MKKLFKLFTISLVMLLVLTSCERVAPNYYGVLMQDYGKNGKEYVFTPVSPKVAEEFKNSESKGKYFNDYIKSNVAFTCLKIVS